MLNGWSCHFPMCLPWFYEIHLTFFFTFPAFLEWKYLFIVLPQNASSINQCLRTWKHPLLHFSCLLFFFFFSSILKSILLQHSDVEANPGPRKIILNSFSWCQWNVNNLIAHNMAKLTQIEAYNYIYKYDKVCISETYFYSSLHISWW